MSDQISTIRGKRALATESLSAADSVAQILPQLEQLIRNKDRRLSERQLSETLGVNRYVLRLAIARLGSEGRIAPSSRRRRKGDSLQWYDLAKQTNPVEIGEIRIALEPFLAGLAATRATPNDIAHLTTLHETAKSRPYDIELDLAFHEGIAKASRNHAAYLIVLMLNDITRDPDFLTKMPPFTEETGFQHHEAVLAAVATRDPTAAQEAMLIHYRAIHRWLLGGPSEVVSAQNSMP